MKTSTPQFKVAPRDLETGGETLAKSRTQMRLPTLRARTALVLSLSVKGVKASQGLCCGIVLVTVGGGWHATQKQGC